MEILENPMAVACPKCGSSSFQSLPLLYATGKSDIHLNGGAVGIGSNLSSGIGAIKMDGIQTSILAQTCAPPEKMKVEGIFFAAITAALTSLFFALFIDAIFCLLFSLGHFWSWAIFYVLFFLTLYCSMLSTIESNQEAKAYNQDQFPKDYAKWRASALCTRCGTVFDLISLIDGLKSLTK